MAEPLRRRLIYERSLGLFCGEGTGVAAAGLELGLVTLDFDATLLDSYSEKQDAAPTYKRGFGFHPFAMWCDETNEPLAAMLRPGNAGANKQPCWRRNMSTCLRLPWSISVCSRPAHPCVAAGRCRVRVVGNDPP